MKTVKIGNVELSSPLFLAPMAGTSTLPFRVICHEFGAGLCTTELASARSIVYNNIEKSFRYMRISPQKEGKTCIQLFGSDAEDFAVAIKRICEDPRLSQVDIIDINMGCPVPKVVKTGAGCALMKDPKCAEGIAISAVNAGKEYGKPVTVKTRIGYSENDGNGIEFAKRLAQTGIAGLCVHGRYGTQMYRGCSDIDKIAQMHEAISDVKLTFIANGDIVDGKSAKAMLDTTGADAIAIGRAAAGNPWVFEQVRGYLDGKSYNEPSQEDRIAMFWRELNDTCELIPEEIAVKESRGQMGAYLKGIPGSSKVRLLLCSATTREQIKRILEESFNVG